MLGLKRGTIELLPYQEAWKKDFLQEKQRIIDRIAAHIQKIEHIGSTAIQGISAKPIIDMAITIEEFEDGLACVAPLNQLGYVYKGENGIAGRHYFRTNDEIVKFHLHMFPKTHPKLRDHLLFRDYLNKHPEEAQKYQELKLALSQQFAQDRELYTSSKARFIEGILEKAKQDIP